MPDPLSVIGAALDDVAARANDPVLVSQRPPTRATLHGRELLLECVECEASDAGNGTRMALRAAGLLLAVTGGSWRVWDGVCWRDDNSERHAAMQVAIRTAEAIEAEPTILRERDTPHLQVVARLRHGLGSQAITRLEAMIKLARVHLSADPDAFDANHMLLNTPTGTVDLRTGEARPHDPDDLISKVTRAPYVPDAESSAWATFLSQVIPDPDTRRYLQRLVGYFLTGETSEQELYVLLGTGANGKSLFIRVLQHVLGDYAVSAGIETFMESKSAAGGTRSDLVRLRGARLVTASESSDGFRLDERLVKEITGGEEIIARTLWKTEEAFAPVLKLLISCNTVPRYDGSDFAMRRRVRIIPFDVTIADADQDPGLFDRLVAESAGILAWAVQGAVTMLGDGLGTCPAVEAASAQAAESLDPFSQFMAEQVRAVDDAFTPGLALRHAYLRWAEANGQPPLDQRQLGIRLSRHGLQQGRTRINGKQHRGWVGITLAEHDAGSVPERAADIRGLSQNGPSTNLEISRHNPARTGPARSTTLPERARG
ncbi:MAG: phage/plasmid primase, P4 family [Patulibacter sp.]|nr:phage/plasmid primase, P4 family [Patulibacter sp.]